MICPNCNKVVPDTNYKCPYCRKVLKEQGVDPLAFRYEHMQKKSQTLTYFLLAAVVIGIAVLAYFLFLTGGKENAKPGNVKSTESRNAAAAPAPSGQPATGPGSQVSQIGTEPDKKNTGETDPEEIPIQKEAGETNEKSDNPYDWVDKEDPVQLARAYVPGTEVDIEKLLLPGQTTIFDFYSEYCPPCRKISPALGKLDSKRKDITVVKLNINRKEVQGIDWGSPVAQQYQLRSIPFFIIYDSTGYRTHEGEEAYKRVMDLLNEEKIQ